MLTYCPQFLAVHPQQHLLLRQSLVYIEMTTMQSDAAIAIGDAWKEGASELALELLGRIQTPFGLPQHMQGNRRSKLLFEQALMGGGVVKLQKVLMNLLELQRCLRQGKLIVKQAPLDVKVCLVRSVG
jgi:hypothetical protein